jgi:hypothetical protein
LSLIDRLHKALGPMLIKPELVRYSSQGVQLSTLDLKGKIIPVLLKIPVK